MTTAPFRYERPETLSAAIAILEEHGQAARALSGGTDLLVGLRSGKLGADVVVDLKRIPEASGELEDTGAGLRVPATYPISEVTADDRVRDRLPALVEAGVTVGSIQIRNRATLAGNICNASPAADTVLPMIIYGASVEVAGPDGIRIVPVEEFILGPGRTDLELGELVVSVTIPWPPDGSGSAFARMTRRRGVDLATVNVACEVAEDGTTRFAFGAAGPRPVVAIDDTGRLADPDLDDVTVDGILRELVATTTPITDIRGSKEYRTAMLVVLARRIRDRALARRQTQGQVHDE